eukprot:scaffold6115_cov57-Phaeocystis_antarctica.AAC.3
MCMYGANDSFPPTLAPAVVFHPGAALAISDVWSAQATAEGLTLLVAENTTGFLGVYLKPGKPKPYMARVSRGGKLVYLGSFATAEEAALCFARSPEGRAAAVEAAAAAVEAAAALIPLTSEEARQQAQAERLTLLVGANTTGYFGVSLNRPGRPKPYQAKLRRGGKMVSLGSFVTAEEAALCVARSPEGQAAAERAAEAPPLTNEEARRQAQAEGLVLLVAENTTGYLGVHLKHPGQPKPYEVQARRGGNKMSLGCFATAEDAALCVARSPKGRAAAQKAAAATRPLTSEEEVKGSLVNEEGVIPPMPPDAYVKVEIVVKKEEDSGSRPKRRRMK